MTGGLTMGGGVITTGAGTGGVTTGFGIVGALGGGVVEHAANNAAVTLTDKFLIHKCL